MRLPYACVRLTQTLPVGEGMGRKASRLHPGRPSALPLQLSTDKPEGCQP